MAGLVYAQQHWGKLPLKAVMEPAIRLARKACALTYEEAQSMHDPDLAKFPDSKRIFQSDGNFYEPEKFSASLNWREPWYAHCRRSQGNEFL